MSRTSYMVGLDLHKKSISYCIKTPSGRIVEKGRMRSNPDEIDRLAGSIRPKSVVGMEATMFTGWVYDRFRSHGFEVKVGHPLMLRAIAVGKKNDEDRKSTRLNSSHTASVGEDEGVGIVAREAVRQSPKKDRMPVSED